MHQISQHVDAAYPPPDAHNDRPDQTVEFADVCIRISYLAGRYYSGGGFNLYSSIYV